jgi:LmbE family N-acetylglucosaminyl deacetylase
VTALAGLPAGAAIHVPGGGDAVAALERTTDLAVVAHPDDLELLCVAPLLDCRDDAGRSFTGVVCTDGAGSVRPAGFEALDDAAWVALRADEQRASADLAGMGAVVLLGLPSSAVGGPSSGSGRRALTSALDVLVRATEPVRVHTHDPTDLHRTHRAVATAAVGVLRALPPGRRPEQVLGWEGWRSLDWLDPASRHTADLSGRLADAAALAACHASQLGAKRYDDATAGRWRSHATFAAARSADDAEALALAWDLTPAVESGVDPTRFVADAVARFGAGATDGVAGWW